ncbi:MAG TPA: glycosyltransferase family 87 protein [Acidobacteriaceae bacterium]|nr:glycosyltransferase family 87 protein [Acidobacteriaceae bacterium]
MHKLTHDISLSQLVRKLALLLVLVLLFEVLLIAIAPRFHSGSVLKIAKDSLFLRVRNDSSYYMAQGDLAWRQHPNALYETVFFHRGVRFIYPPTALLLYRAWQAAARIGIPPSVAMNAMLLLALLGTMAVAGEFLLRLLPERIIRESTPADCWKVRALVGALIFVFLPLINAYRLGQVQTLLNFLVIAGAFLWLRGRRISSAIFIGLTCWLKPQMSLYLLWGLLRRQWSFAISLFITLLAGLSLSLAVFGWHNTTDYLQVLSFLSRRGDALATNQSLNGLLHRVMHVGSPVTWIYGYPPYNRSIYLATVCSSALVLALALALPILRHRTRGVADFLVFAMATTMASPIAWEHHYGVFFLVFLLWTPLASIRWKTFFTILTIYLLMTDMWAPLTPLMFTRWSFLISHVYFGGLALFLYTLFREQREAFGREPDRQHDAHPG